ncbi:MAG: MFS transporter [Bacteroidales bacterium]|nr:MFS transporter [Bacteroidales bacterium]MDZ4203819.1 MFS transporter [Bacteroidales bacterium]
MKEQSNTLKVGMVFISMIFFIFGFVTTFIITLSDPVKEAFNLSYTQAFLVNSAFFISYALFSIPAGGVIKRIGYKNAIVTGLLLVSLAGFLFFPAIRTESYLFFLGAIFILSMGVVLLQTAANPFVTALGPDETASGRLNLTQALNSIATWIAPLLIVALILPSQLPSGGASETSLTETVKVQPGDLLLPFIIIAVLVLIIAFAVWRIRLPELSQKGQGNYKTVFKYRHMLLGALAIFCYVGAEVGIGTAISSYIVLPEIGVGMSRELALKFVGLYWAGAMIGRLFGAIELSGIQKQKVKIAFAAIVMVWAFVVGFITLEYSLAKALIFFAFAIVNYLLMQLGKGKANTALSIFAGAAVVLAVVSMLATGNIALWTIVTIGLFNSIMFPNIFALAVRTLDKSEVSLASGVINTLIVGGAVIPLLMGVIGDAFGIQVSFVIPVLCYLYILYYAVSGSRVQT